MQFIGTQPFDRRRKRKAEVSDPLPVLIVFYFGVKAMGQVALALRGSKPIPTLSDFGISELKRPISQVMRKGKLLVINCRDMPNLTDACVNSCVQKLSEVSSRIAVARLKLQCAEIEIVRLRPTSCVVKNVTKVAICG